MSLFKNYTTYVILEGLIITGDPGFQLGTSFHVTQLQPGYSNGKNSWKWTPLAYDSYNCLSHKTVWYATLPTDVQSLKYTALLFQCLHGFYKSELGLICDTTFSLKIVNFQTFYYRNLHM